MKEAKKKKKIMQRTGEIGHADVNIDLEKMKGNSDVHINLIRNSVCHLLCTLRINKCQDYVTFDIIEPNKSDVEKDQEILHLFAEIDTFVCG